MDAKVGDWVVTPRHGKAVEINALWYNARACSQAGCARSRETRLHATWPSTQSRHGRPSTHGSAPKVDTCTMSSTARGEDAARRPNQVFALSLRHPILDQARWERILAVVRQHLLTPVGLRSLAPRPSRLQAQVRRRPARA